MLINNALKLAAAPSVCSTPTTARYVVRNVLFPGYRRLTQLKPPLPYLAARGLCDLVSDLFRNLITPRPLFEKATYG